MGDKKELSTNTFYEGLDELYKETKESGEVFKTHKEFMVNLMNEKTIPQSYLRQ